MGTAETPAKTQRQTIRNDTPGDVEVMVEMDPERYVLKPGDTMVIEAEVPADGDEVFYVVVTTGGLQIYPLAGVPERVWINGQPAVENWEGST